MVQPARFESPSGVQWETVDALITRYQINIKTFHKWMAMGLPVHRFPGGGRNMRIDPAEVDAWFREQGSRNRCSDPGAGTRCCSEIRSCAGTS